MKQTPVQGHNLRLLDEAWNWCANSTQDQKTRTINPSGLSPRSGSRLGVEWVGLQPKIRSNLFRRKCLRSVGVTEDRGKNLGLYGEKISKMLNDTETTSFTPPTLTETSFTPPTLTSSPYLSWGYYLWHRLAVGLWPENGRDGGQTIAKYMPSR